MSARAKPGARPSPPISFRLHPSGLLPLILLGYLAWRGLSTGEWSALLWLSGALILLIVLPLWWALKLRRGAYHWSGRKLIQAQLQARLRGQEELDLTPAERATLLAWLERERPDGVLAGENTVFFTHGFSGHGPASHLTPEQRAQAMESLRAQGLLTRFGKGGVNDYLVLDLKRTHARLSGE